MEPSATDKTAVIMIGLQASGKSTYYQRYYAQTHVHINLDRLHTRNKERQLLLECIEKGLPFAVDNTNPTAQDRARYILPAKQAGYRIVGLFFRSRVAECIARNEGRSGKAKVPVAAITATSGRLELPGMSEGFDEMYYVSMTDDGFALEIWHED